MAFKDLTTATMVSLSAAWLDPKRQRPILTKLKRTKPFIEDLEDAHAGLLRFQKKRNKLSAEQQQLGDQAAALDATHDRLARGIYNTLDGLVDLTDDADRRAALLTLRDELMPNGLSITKGSYTDEAGEAELVEKRLSTASKALLKKEIVDDEPLAAYVAKWQTAARELGKVEQQRIDLAAAPVGESSAKTPGAARNAWIRVMNAIVDILDLEKGLSAESRRKLLDPIEAAQRKAARVRAGGSPDDEEPAPEDGATVEPAPAPVKPDAVKKKPEPVE